MTTVVWHAEPAANLHPATDWLAPAEASRAAALTHPKRRSEFLLGRWAAKVALAPRLALPLTPAALARIAITNADDGAPELTVDHREVPLALSLTHRAGWAVCAHADAGLALGCDLELVEPRSEAFIADYLTAAERAVVAAAHDDDDRQRLANLLWSAKESALKVLRTGLRRDTRSVEVSLAAPALAAWSALTVRTAEGQRLSGWWRRYGAFVLTVAADAAIAPPVALHEPPALAAVALPDAGALPPSVRS